MKMLKKMAALLLAGVMAMALLTACGDEAPAKSAAEQAEDAMFIAFNQAIGTEFKNDEAMKNVARKAITDNVGEDGKVVNGKIFGADQEKNMMWVIYPDVDHEGTALGITAEQVAQLKDPKFAQDLAQDMVNTFGKDTLEAMKKTIEVMGVGAVTKNGKTYIAIAVTFKATAAQPQ